MSNDLTQVQDEPQEPGEGSLVWLSFATICPKRLTDQGVSGFLYVVLTPHGTQDEVKNRLVTQGLMPIQDDVDPALLRYLLTKEPGISEDASLIPYNVQGLLVPADKAGNVPVSWIGRKVRRHEMDELCAFLDTEAQVVKTTADICEDCAMEQAAQAHKHG